jgi:hypothetical protein
MGAFAKSGNSKKLIKSKAKYHCNPKALVTLKKQQ